MGPNDEEPKHPGASNAAELVPDGGPQVGGGGTDEPGRWRTSLLVPAIIIAVTCWMKSGAAAGTGGNMSILLVTVAGTGT